MEQRSLVYSLLLLHVGVLLVAVFGVPALFPHHEEPTPLVMTVDILPIAAITNIKPSDQPIQKEQKAPTPPAPKAMPQPPAAPPKPAAQPPEEALRLRPHDEGARKPKPDNAQARRAESNRAETE